MTPEQHKIINYIWLYLVSVTFLVFSILIITGVCHYYKFDFLKSSSIIALISFVGVNVIGLVSLIVKWLFKE
jgi:hypothetical protein